MSRSKLIRALLAMASLLGAVPLMGQTAVAAMSGFPYGNYTSTLPADDNHASARTLQVVMREGSMQVFEDGQLIQSYLTSVNGRDWKVWRVGGACGEGTPIQGDYTWNMAGDVLTFALVSDDCPGRGAKMVKTRLVRAAAASSAMAVTAASTAPATAGGFPYGTYSLIVVDSANAPPPGLQIEFTTTKMNVSQGGQPLASYSISVDGPKWEVFELGGNGCSDPGDYTWELKGDLLTLTVINDPCTERAMQIQAVRFHRM